MIQISATKIYAAFVALMLLVPMTSFNNNTGSKIEKQSKISKKIALEKAKIDLELQRATYSEGISQTY
jgi:hypothetical protein